MDLLLHAFAPLSESRIRMARLTPSPTTSAHLQSRKRDAKVTKGVNSWVTCYMSRVI